MRDPLNNSENAFSLLGLSSNTNGEEVSQFIESRTEAQLAAMSSIETTSLKQLQDPLYLARLPILDFLPEYLKDVVPTPLSNPVLLDLPTRPDTVHAWEDIFKRQFPDQGLTHTLAVTWYWWIHFEEEKLAAFYIFAESENVEVAPQLHRKELLGKLRQKGTFEQQKWIEEEYDLTTANYPTLNVMLQKFVNYWVMLLSYQKFWKNRMDLPASDCLKMRDNLLQEIKKWLTGFEKRMRKTGMKLRRENGLVANEEVETPAPTSAVFKNFIKEMDPIYAMMASILVEEFKLSQTMVAANLLHNGKPLACGRRILSELAICKQIRREVMDRFDSNPESQPLQQINAELSPYSRIEKMIQLKKGHEALAEIERLSPEERQESEVEDLKAKIFTLLGENEINAGREGNGLEEWRSALSMVRTKAIRESLVLSMTATTQTRAEKLGKADPQKGIEFLENIIRMIPDETLKATMGSLLAKKSAVLLDSLDKQDKRGTLRCSQETINNLRQSRKDLEYALRLGHRSAIEHLERSRKMESDAELGLLGLPKGLKTLLLGALKSRQRHEYGSAVSQYRSLLGKLKDRKVDIISKQFAATLLQLVRQRIRIACRYSNTHASISGLFSSIIQGQGKAMEELGAAQKNLTEAVQVEPDLKLPAGELRLEIQTYQKMLQEGKILPLPSGERRGKTKSVKPKSRIKWIIFAFLLTLVTLAIIFSSWQSLVLLFPLVIISALMPGK